MWQNSLKLATSIKFKYQQFTYIPKNTLLVVMGHSAQNHILSVFVFVVPAQSTAEEMRLILETMADIGSLQVSRQGYCSNYTWTVKWLSRSGDQPLLNVCINHSPFVVSNISTLCKNISLKNYNQVLTLHYFHVKICT